MPIFVLSDKPVFPPAHLATAEGLLAVGGDLSRQRLLHAYRRGIFPWFSEEEPILWWSPDPRLVIYPYRFRANRSLRRALRKAGFRVTADQAFGQVIAHCAATRLGQGEGTWITAGMEAAYKDLHNAGYAHSFEVWSGSELVGGLYGVALGKCFFGESMFSKITDASKVAFAHLISYLSSRLFHLIDCQVTTDHMLFLGAEEISRSRFLKELQDALIYPTHREKWHYRPGKETHF